MSDWNTRVHNDRCNLAEHTVAHEAGHALGIGRQAAGFGDPDHPDGGQVSDHPRNTTLSIMSSGYTHTTYYCEPQAYDILALMANYQSR